MQRTVYAFEDLHVTITHPAIEPLYLQGSGVVSVAFVLAEDTSSVEAAADGSTMHNKIKRTDGTVAVTMLQTSEGHKWFTRLYNYLRTAPSNEHNQVELAATSHEMQAEHHARYCAIQKRADRTYGATGENVTWTLLAAEIDEI